MEEELVLILTLYLVFEAVIMIYGLREQTSTISETHEDIYAIKFQQKVMQKLTAEISALK